MNNSSNDEHFQPIKYTLFEDEHKANICRAIIRMEDGKMEKWLWKFRIHRIKWASNTRFDRIHCSIADIIVLAW